MIIIRTIKGYTDYFITHEGIVWSKKRNKIISPYNNGKGYLQIYLWKNKKRKRFYIRRLVIEHFIPNLLNKFQINHKDGNKQNNNINNLEWCTRSENMQHASKNGLMRKKLTEQQVLEIREKYKSGNYTHRQLSKMYNVVHSVIGNIINKKLWVWV